MSRKPVATQLPFLDRGIFFAKAHPTTSYAIGRPSTTALLRAGLTHGADGYRRVSGQDAGPCAQVRGTYLVAQRRDCGHQIERCASGLLSVVLGRRQRSPNGHNRIANELLDSPAVQLDQPMGRRRISAIATLAPLLDRATPKGS